MNKADLERVFQILEYIKDNEFKNEYLNLKSVYDFIGATPDWFRNAIIYLESKGYIKLENKDNDNFFAIYPTENTPTYSRGHTTPEGVEEVYSRERKRVESELNISIIDTNRIQKWSVLTSVGVSIVAIILSTLDLNNGQAKELRQQNTILQSQTRALQDLMKVQKEGQAILLMIAKGDSLGKKK